MATNNSFTKAELRFKKYLDAIMRELHNAYWHFIIYKHLEKDRVEYQKELREAPEFWGLTQRAHLFDTIMRLNKICDDDKETINILTLLDFSKQNVHIFADESFTKRKGYARDQNLPKIDKSLLSEHRQKYTTFSDTNLRKLRNRVLAHIDKTIVMKDVWPFKKWSVNIAQIETIINDLDNTLNLLSTSFDGNKYIKEFTHLEQSMNVTLELMRKGIIERERLEQAALKQDRGK